jgi:hypothetical protein
MRSPEGLVLLSSMAMVLSPLVCRGAGAVPFDADDLAGWAVRLYDQNLRHPDLARLIAWTRLERCPTGRWFDSAQHEDIGWRYPR